MNLTATDFFCGMGGSSTGLVRAGFDVKAAANHWARAIETHSANHPDTEHLLGDIQAVDMRYLPRTTMLWASPICTEVSPAGGTAKRTPQMDLFEEYGHVPTEAFERTRVTFWEVIRAAEVHRYPYIAIENVKEAADWELFDTWLMGMTTLGYSHQFISVSAAHVGDDWNPHAPQWRDRLYIVFTRHGLPQPDVDPRPLAWCEHCGNDVPAVQFWKRAGRRIGKYGPQYIYVCPEPGHGQVEPYVTPAAAAIDWSNLGERIGDRKRPLAKRTMERIRRGIELVQSGALSFSMANGGRARPWDVTTEPMRTHTTAQTEALVVAAAGNTYDGAVNGGSYVRAWPAAGAPTPAQTTTSQLGLVTPPPDGAFLTMLRRNGANLPVGQPAPTFTGGGYHHGLVIPFRRGSRPYRATDGPLSTMATRDQHGVMHPAIDIDDCHFRMLTPREAANAQAFPREYIIHGNAGEQQMQAGNAVATNVAAWIGRAIANALDSRVAA